MDFYGASYLAAISAAAAAGRAIKKWLPNALRLRLEAEAPPRLPTGWVWVHAVSVGELMLAAGLLGKLKEKGCRAHVTTSTEAGAELLASRLPGWDGGSGCISGGCFPIDCWHGLKTFFSPPPGSFVSLETEIWPNLYRELDSRGIPICIVNGRLTARTAGSLFGPWLRRAAARLSLVAARDEESAKLFSAMGAPNVALGGNLKADAPPPPPLHGGWANLKAGWQGMPILVAGNTVEGEEEIIMDAFRQIRKRTPGLRAIVAPRQPKRFDAAAGIMGKAGVSYRRASAGWAEGADEWRQTDALLLDTIGELASAYGLGQVALVGGGWRWHGGHNPLEPLYWGVPTLIGPGCANFGDLVQPLLEAGCLEIARAENIAEAAQRLLALGLEDRPKIPEHLKGCMQRTWDCLEPFLPCPGQ
jgi:3-deoxy-D-manno-octulosonic-acid transferase